MNYEVVIGLEIHCQLATESKLFASDVNRFGDEPNTNISVLTLAHPGVLPKTNAKAVEYAVKMGLACGSKINQFTFFDRKNYFYADSPKGYQTSQDKYPICVGGGVKIRLRDGKEYREHTISLHQIHLEEDAGKSIHDLSETETFLDFNRAGTPLIEIVSDPCITSGEEAGAYLNEVRRMVRYLGICDGNMEEGSMRADLNISLRPKGQKELGTKVEIKNMNSIRNLQRAVEFEIVRQSGMLDNGEKLIQETRKFNADNGETYGMRVKETMNDYRYFPEPDLAPIRISDAQLLEIEQSMPSLPATLFPKFVNEYGLSPEHATTLIEDKEWVDYFEATLEFTTEKQLTANWIISTIRGYLSDNKLTLESFSITPERLAEIVNLVAEDKVSNTAATQQLLPLMIENAEKSAEMLANEHQLIQQSDSGTLQILIDEVLIKNAKKVAEFKKGKKGLLGMFVGQVMQASKGTADPKKVNELLLKSLQ
ncbi:MAG: Asp-tRNA(Asn)/Glu-tRNA(Gln) amidotransferase subunit GatB [Spirosomaceae bacterium]|nr:Asp-tRNA(Asn)/Glu-tRNA(Gln) amidotransferase subunit GatB [Spirosomataceae bacterium]